MRPMRFLLLALVAPLLHAQRPTAPFDMPLYGGEYPGAPRSTRATEFTPATAKNPIALVMHVQEPSMRVYLPPRAKATGAAVVICPGGGYAVLAIDHEGWQEAQWLVQRGIAAIVVSYRVSARDTAAYPYPVPLLDARQAMRRTRANATAWGIDPERVGVMGFSAGGHLASMLLTMADVPLPADASDGLASYSSRPSFGVLVYPVISMHQPWGHRGSADNLLRNVPPAQRAPWSTETRVSGVTPPTILIAAQDDDVVPVQNAIAFYQAMVAAKVPGELHLWEKGGHGYGMLPDRGPAAREWMPVVHAWLRGRGLLSAR